MFLGLTLYQLIIALFALIFLLSSISKFTKKESRQTVFKFLASAFIWGSILFFSIFPQTAHSISESLGMGDNLNTFVFIAIVILFATLFKLINTIEKIERDITEIVRKESLNKLNKKT